MKIDKYVKLKNNKYRLYFDNGEVIDTYDDIIIELELLLKRNIDLVTYNKIIEDSNIYGYYYDCIKYINVRVRSINEIKSYLKRKKVSDDYSNIIIDKLIKNKYLDDNYFCSCFIKDKLRFTSWGPYKISQELGKHFIDSSIISNNISAIDYDFVYDKLVKLVDKKISINKKLNNYSLKNKLYGYFVNIGYDASMVIDILNDKL